MSRRGLTTALPLLSVCCCTSAPPPEPAQPALPSRPPIAFVAAGGDDQGPGSEASPYATLGRAIREPGVERVRLAPGKYAGPALVIDRAFAIEGPRTGEGEPPAVEATVEVRAGGTEILGVNLAGGLAINGARGVRVERVAISVAISAAQGQPADALAIDGSVAELREIAVSCAGDSCLRIKDSTVTIESATLVAREKTAGGSKRGLHAISSSVTARRLTTRGFSVAGVQAVERAQLSLFDSVSERDSLGVTALSGSTLIGARLGIVQPIETGLLVSVASARVSEVKIGSAQRGLGVAVQGGELHLGDATVDAAPRGTIQVHNHSTRGSKVRIAGGTVRCDQSHCLVAGQGEVIAQGTRFLGDAKNKRRTEDAVVASGQEASLQLDGVTIDAAGAHAVGVYNSASATISATISRPKMGGIFVESTPGATVTIRGTTIEGCQGAAGITIFDAPDVNIEAVSIKGCEEAGLLAGQNATVRASGLRVQGAKRYGVAVFGDSELSLKDSVVAGASWSAFASCGDGSRIVDGGGNTLKGPSTLCP